MTTIRNPLGSYEAIPDPVIAGGTKIIFPSVYPLQFVGPDDMRIGAGTTVGLRIGTAATQKISFFGATPVVRGVHIADATDATTVITRVNAVLAQLESFGLLATS